MSSFTGLSQIGQIALTVANLDRAVAFYQHTLGLPLLFRAPPGLAFLDCAGVRLMLSEPEGAPAAAPSSVLYFRVADIHAAYTGLQAGGVAFHDTPHCIARLPDHDLWMTFFRDPDANQLALMSEVREPRATPAR
ncbi:MAG TPA: VOC family protein [Gemmatimonadaceae bacterium]|nr:VOC family protein [Gemmatimonadaceae bacterium]